MPIDNLLELKPAVLEAILPLFEHEREDKLNQIKALRNQQAAIEIEIENCNNAIQRSQDHTNVILVHLASQTEGFLRRLNSKRADSDDND